MFLNALLCLKDYFKRYYRNNYKAVKKLVAKYDMYEVPLDQIYVIGIQERLNINVLLYENNGWKNYKTKYNSNGLLKGIFNNLHVLMLKNCATS